MLTWINPSGFKSFGHDEETMALGPLTLLVGANAAGKSNLLELIRFFQGLAVGFPVVEVIQGVHRGGSELLACLAVHEVEVWMCALHRNSLGIGWSEVRDECDPKERFANPLLDRLGRRGPGDGRKRAMRALAGQWAGLLRVCPELSELAERIRAWSAAR